MGSDDQTITNRARDGLDPAIRTFPPKHNHSRKKLVLLTKDLYAGLPTESVRKALKVLT